jgi:hypothetical protein
MEVAFVLGATVFIGFILSRFALIIDDYLRIQYSVWLEVGMVLGQVLFQWAFLWRRPFADKWRYALELITVSLLGAVLLVPLVVWDYLYGVSVPAALVYFFSVVTVMFIDHWRRVSRMGLPWFLCATWVFYRCILLILLVG